MNLEMWLGNFCIEYVDVDVGEYVVGVVEFGSNIVRVEEVV